MNICSLLGRRSGLGLLGRLLWAVALALPVFGAKGVVQLTTLYTFGASTNNGVLPGAALAQGSDGNFYGTTENGGTSGVGTVFRMSPDGTLTTLYSFGGTNDGGYPSAALVQGRDGNFYGTTSSEGDTNYSDPWSYDPPGWGTVFKISPNGALTTLYDFTGLLDGGIPSGLIQGSDGYFYGTTDLDTVFQISSNGALVTLGSPDGDPIGGLVQGSDGYLYGTTLNGGPGATIENPGYGSIFKIATDGKLITMYSFTGGKDGGNPFAGLAAGGDGYFYGTTLYGGITTGAFNNGCGGVFKIGTNGVFAPLHLFTGGEDGANPYATMALGADGNLYGTTSYGGKISPTFRFGYGTVFKINARGALTTVYSFTGLSDGDYPNGLILGSDGAFYGTTQELSSSDTLAGTVFRLIIAPDPQLAIIPSAANVSLSWPANYGAFSYGGYTLQTTTNLGPSAVWSAVSSSPVVIGGQNVVVHPVSGARQFFRLASPQ